MAYDTNDTAAAIVAASVTLEQTAGQLRKCAEKMKSRNGLEMSAEVINHVMGMMVNLRLDLLFSRSFRAFLEGN